MLPQTVIQWVLFSFFGNKTAKEAFVYNPKHKDYQDGSVTEVIADLEAGMTVKIDTMRAPALFTPYAGKPNLGFK